MGAGAKTNLLFSIKGRPPEQVWYCDLSDVKTTMKKPLVLAHFDDLARLLPQRENG